MKAATIGVSNLRQTRERILISLLCPLASRQQLPWCDLLLMSVISNSLFVVIWQNYVWILRFVAIERLFDIRVYHDNVSCFTGIRLGG